jgi:hypothetical protein
VFNATRSLQRSHLWPQHHDPVLIVLDGDDWLFDDSSLWTVAAYYASTGCWATHGSFVEFPSENYILWQRQLHLSAVDAAAVRQGDWITSHLRTFRHSLYARINHEHLKQNGAYLQFAADLALMFPVLEMAGHRVEWVREIVHVYNVKTPYQDHKHSVAEQHAVAAYLRGLPRYHRLPGARIVPRAAAVTAWFEGCAVHSSSSPDDPAPASSSRCTRRVNDVQLTVRATGVWVPEEAVLLLEVFDAGGLLRAEHEVNEQQLGLQLGGGFDPGAYRVVVSLLPLQQDAETGRGGPLAAVAIPLILQ